MSKIFLSHSSDNNAQALALAQWLKENGWDDYFLDIEPTRGISPGERWQHSLKQAAQYCELIILLISPAWRDLMCQHFTGHKVKQHFAATRSQRAIYIH